MKRSLIALVALVTTGSMFGVACGDGEPHDPDNNSAGSGGDGDGDGDGDTGGNVGTGGTVTGGQGGMPSTPLCSPSQELCGDFCTNTDSDPENCGECGGECGPGEGCMAGECERFGCSSGQVECADGCVDLHRDPDNCGDCGTVCAAGESCSEGACVNLCPEGQMSCGSTCIDPETDLTYCGATHCGEDGMGGAASEDTLGETCDSGNKCVDGACVLDCGTLLACNGSCIDPLNDPTYCGATDCGDVSTQGVECSEIESCVIGECREFVRDWSEGTRVDIAPNAVQVTQSIATNASGQALVVWRQSTVDNEFDSNRLFGSAYDPATKSWGTPTQISTAPLGVRNLQVVLADSGEGMVLWVEGSTADANRLLAARFDTSSQEWSAPIRVDNFTDEATATDSIDNPHLAIDPLGNALIVWAQGPYVSGESLHPKLEIYRNRYDLSMGEFLGATAFAKVTPDSAGSSFDNASVPRIAINDSGIAVVVWHEYTDIAGYWGPEGGTTPVVSFADITAASPSWSVPVAPRLGEGLGGNTFSLDVGIDDAGNATIAYSAYDAGGGNYDQNLYTSSCDLSAGSCAGWANDKIGDLWASGKQFAFARIDVQRDGRATVAARVETQLVAQPYHTSPYWVYAVAFNGTVWESPVELSGEMGNRPEPLVASDAQGNTFVSWVADTNAESSRYSVDAATWVGPVSLNNQTLVSGAGSPTLAVSAGGNAFSSWIQTLPTLGNSHLYVGRYN